MEFLLNQNLEVVSLGEINPNTTVLQWLRSNDLTGSKEGCASGDCGEVCVITSGQGQPGFSRPDTALEKHVYKVPRGGIGYRHQRAQVGQ